MKKKLVSIIIPVYDCEQHLRKCIYSIINQKISFEYEIILVDDGSVDKSGFIADELEKDYSFIRTFHKINGGVSSARNLGIEKAVGEYLWFVDSDDLLISDSLLFIVEALGRKPDIVSFGMRFDYYQYGRIIQSDTFGVDKMCSYHKKEWVEDFDALFYANMLSPVWNKWIRRELIISNSIRFNEQMLEMEDYLFSIQCMCKADMIIAIPNVIYRYRQSTNVKHEFNRLLKISNISTYVSNLEDSVNKAIYPYENRTASKAIYLHYFMQVLRYGDIEIIKKMCLDMLEGSYSEYVAEAQPLIYDYAVNKEYSHILRFFFRRKLRHKFAFNAKYLLSFVRRKNEDK